jgi:hypothetical protein
MNPIHAGHASRRNLSPEGQHVIRIGAELHMVPADPALQFAMLMRAVDRSGNGVSSLFYLDMDSEISEERSLPLSPMDRSARR